MQSLSLVFQAMAGWIGQWLNTATSNWFLSILVFLQVLSLIVSVLILVRGGKR